MTDPAQPKLSFPCEFPIKVIGKAEDDFAAFVMELISRHVPDLSPDSFAFHPSSNGKYLSVSLTFMAESRAQVDRLYLELSSHKRIRIVL